MKASKYEFTMELLASMASSILAKRHGLSSSQAFDNFIKSKTAAMLFDEDLVFWWNGPDYIADEYEREVNALLSKK